MQFAVLKQKTLRYIMVEVEQQFIRINTSVHVVIMIIQMLVISVNNT